MIISKKGVKTCCACNQSLNYMGDSGFCACKPGYDIVSPSDLCLEICGDGLLFEF